MAAKWGKMEKNGEKMEQNEGLIGLNGIERGKCGKLYAKWQQKKGRNGGKIGSKRGQVANFGQNGGKMAAKWEKWSKMRLGLG